MCRTRRELQYKCTIKQKIFTYFFLKIKVVYKKIIN